MRRGAISLSRSLLDREENDLCDDERMSRGGKTIASVGVFVSDSQRGLVFILCNVCQWSSLIMIKDDHSWSLSWSSVESAIKYNSSAVLCLVSGNWISSYTHSVCSWKSTRRSREGGAADSSIVIIWVIREWQSRVNVRRSSARGGLSHDQNSDNIS